MIGTFEHREYATAKIGEFECREIAVEVHRSGVLWDWTLEGQYKGDTEAMARFRDLALGSNGRPVGPHPVRLPDRREGRAYFTNLRHVWRYADGGHIEFEMRGEGELMSANRYWRPTPPPPPPTGEVSYSVWCHIRDRYDLHSGYHGPFTLAQPSIPYLEGLRDACPDDDDKTDLTAMIDGIREHGSIKVWEGQEE